jgi:putative intracellular protease/amidase
LYVLSFVSSRCYEPFAAPEYDEWFYKANIKTNRTTTDAPAPGPWDAFHVVDGRVVSGTNPASATETAEAILEVFKTL